MSGARTSEKCLLTRSDIEHLYGISDTYMHHISENHAFVIGQSIPSSPSESGSGFYLGLATQSLLWQQSFLGNLSINHTVQYSKAYRITLNFEDNALNPRIGAVFFVSHIDVDMYADVLFSYISAVRNHGKMLNEVIGNARNAVQAASWFPLSVTSSSSSEPLLHAFQKVRMKCENMDVVPSVPQINMCFQHVLNAASLYLSKRFTIMEQRRILEDLSLIGQAQTRAIFVRSWKLFKDKWLDEKCSWDNQNNEQFFLEFLDFLGKSGFVAESDSHGYPSENASCDRWPAFKRIEFNGWSQDKKEKTLSFLSASSLGPRDETFFENPPIISPQSEERSLKLNKMLYQDSNKKLSSKSVSRSGFMIGDLIDHRVFEFLRQKSIASLRGVFPGHPVPDKEMWTFVRNTLHNCINAIDLVPYTCSDMDFLPPIDYMELLPKCGHFFFETNRKPGRILLFHTHDQGKNSESDFLCFMERFENPFRIGDFAELIHFQVNHSIASLPILIEKYVSLDRWEKELQKPAKKLFSLDAKSESEGFPFFVDPKMDGPFCSCCIFSLQNTCEHILLGLYALFPATPLPRTFKSARKNPVNDVKKEHI